MTISEIEKEFDDKFVGLWLDGMHDYEIDEDFSEEEAIKKIKSFYRSHFLSTIESIKKEIESKKAAQELYYKYDFNSRYNLGLNDAIEILTKNTE